MAMMPVIIRRDSPRLQPLLRPVEDVDCEDNDVDELESAASSQDTRESFVRNFSINTARRVISTRPAGVLGGGMSTRMSSRMLASDIELVEKAGVREGGVILPWNRFYRIWWHATAIGALLVVFLAPYQIAFEEKLPAVSEFDPSCVLEKVLTFLYTIDIIVNFNLAQYSKDETMIYERRQIASEYFFRGMFWVDFVGVFPFHAVALLLLFEAEELEGTSPDDASLLSLSLLRLFRFARLHRVKKLMDELQYNPRVSLLSFTLLRNLLIVIMACHVQACFMYFLAHVRGFGEETWLGPSVHESETRFGRYITSMYWSITTFCTVGYGDLSPINTAEKIADSFFMLVNVAIAAWIIGSITLLILKGDQKTREYRDSLETLDKYGSMHGFDETLLNKLKDQLRLGFNNREISDEQVLTHFPSAVRRKLLRRLYKRHLVKTNIMTGVRPQFVDAFLTSCTVEIFSPGEEIVERGSIMSDLFLIVGGIAQVMMEQNRHSFSHDPESCNQAEHHWPKLEEGDFIGDIGFFTESPQVYSVISLTAVKTLTMSRSTYKLLAQDHPGSVGKILQNLLAKVEVSSMKVQLPKSIELLRAGSLFESESKFDINRGYQSLGPAHLSPGSAGADSHSQESLAAVKDLVTMHMHRTLDDETTKLLYAASRGDTRTIALMCGHGFDPDNTDYDQRTALMVASMKGNSEAVKLLLQYHASPNKIDMHGSSALLEAIKNGHENIMNLLFQNGASLCMPEGHAAYILCQAVFDGDILLLKRLLKARIDVNATDYDKRTAAHIAAAEGNAAAIRLLAEWGADLTLPDRWGNTVENEARRSHARQIILFLQRRKK